MKFLFGLSVFNSAFLLFHIQPMLAKHILPYFGGVSSVWTSAMLTYQLLLLFGYLLAHFLQKINYNKQPIFFIFLSVFLIIFFCKSNLTATQNKYIPQISVAATIILNIGLPFVLLSCL